MIQVWGIRDGVLIRKCVQVRDEEDDGSWSLELKGNMTIMVSFLKTCNF